MEQTMTVNGWEFQVITLLGHGKGGYSWLVSREGREYVLKQIHHDPVTTMSSGTSSKQRSGIISASGMQAFRFPGCWISTGYRKGS